MQNEIVRFADTIILHFALCIPHRISYIEK